MSTLNLDSVLDATLGSQSEREQPWRRFGLLQNPFPSRAHPIWDVFHNQQQVRDRFLRDLGEFLQQRNTVTLFFTGGNRVGKTHFMEHHRRVLPAKLQSRAVAVPIALVSTQSCDFMHLYQQAVEQIDESLRLQVGSGLFQDPLPPHVVEHLRELPPGDFRRAVERFAGAGAQRDAVGALIREWLGGGRLRVTSRRHVDVRDNVDTVAHALNAFESLLRLLLLWDSAETSTYRCPGVLLFLDEFELIWGYRRDRRDQFLQTLRALVDACHLGLFMCVGMATGIGPTIAEVERAYPALSARLRGAQAVPALIQVGGVVDALGYANAFLEHGKALAAQRGIKRASEALLSNEEIERLFKQVAPLGSVPQGDFFDQLHNHAERKAARVLTG
ncbi:MAG: hypothetical protein IT372_21145 [Polyangiaceae bacterium]|nr:hypothetical protein [Polyangiaceae bacterium]